MPGMIIGVLVSTLLGNDALAWVAALAAMLVTVLVQRARGRSTSCALPSTEEPASGSAERVTS